MELPFSPEQFLAVFVTYNSAVWPMQIVLNLLALTAVGLCFRASVPSRTIAGILSVLWIWTGVVYHWIFFRTINPAALAFGAVFVIQGLIFLLSGVLTASMRFGFQSRWQGYTGGVLILYALVLYPVIGHLLGHGYPASPTFGAPCPTTIFTFGLLVWTLGRLKWYLYVLPLLWSLLGFTAAFKLGISEDLGLLLAGMSGTFILAMSGRMQARGTAA